MKKGKRDRIKLSDNYSGEENDIKSFIIILIVLVILIIGVYFFSRLCVTKDLLTNNDENKESEAIPGEISYDTTLIGTMLNKGDSEYYVYIYDSNNIQGVYYGGLAGAYLGNEDALPVYYADLGNELNKKFYDPDNIKISSNDLENLKVGDVTLLHISKGKIKNSYTDISEIEKVLKKNDDK